eukprot:CAMPEP_0172473684 /NCGR_PEP_ID=MMETSP1065-20121228/68979_1 /TAXON_ID=265537 /ORGANISM="Amphiprora paludosa, Strain CCMP125" /LENGTH=246 /DNA_ID=CAMNT_0013231859 /DNA_START=90 /DNA_END=830 /DNA_ORIENTATION=-
MPKTPRWKSWRKSVRGCFRTKEEERPQEDLASSNHSITHSDSETQITSNTENDNTNTDMFWDLRLQSLGHTASERARTFDSLLDQLHAGARTPHNKPLTSMVGKATSLLNIGYSGSDDEGSEMSVSANVDQPCKWLNDFLDEGYHETRSKKHQSPEETLDFSCLEKYRREKAETTTTSQQSTHSGGEDEQVNGVHFNTDHYLLPPKPSRHHRHDGHHGGSSFPRQQHHSRPHHSTRKLTLARDTTR